MVAAAERSRGNSIRWPLVGLVLTVFLLLGSNFAVPTLWRSGSAAPPAPSSSFLSPQKPIAGGTVGMFSAVSAASSVTVASNSPTDLGPVSGQFSVSSVSIGRDPFWATFDPSNGYVYVPNYYDQTVSVLNGASVVATVPVGNYPDCAVYDAGSGDVYVSNSNSNNVTIISGTKTVGNPNVGYYPWHLAYDAANGYVYVPNRNSNTVTVLSGTKTIATVTVGSSPWNVTYDPSNHLVYVLNDYGYTVSVLNGTKVAATIPVGYYPTGATYDADNGWVYVTNSNSNNITVLNGTKRVANITVGSYPQYGVYDPSNHYIYQTNRNSRNVTVINGTKIVGSVTTSFYPATAAYNPLDGLVYVADQNSPGYVSIINGTTEVTNLSVGGYPYDIVYDDANGMIATANEVGYSASFIQHNYNITFSELGLPAATTWSVNVIGGGAGSGNTSAIMLQSPNGEFRYSVASNDRTYSAPTGRFNVSRDALTVPVVFSRVTFPVNFTEVGLPAGTAWSVTLAGVTLNLSGPNASMIAFRAPNGTEGYRLGVVPGWTTGSFVSTVTVTGLPVSVTIRWSVNTYPVLFNESGLLPGTGWWINVSFLPSMFSTATNLTVAAGNGSYTYSVATSDKKYHAPHNAFGVTGGAAYENVVFTLVLYLVNFTETGLLKGTHWSVSIGGMTLHGGASYLNTMEANGSYSYALGPVPGWTIASYTGTVTVHGKPPATNVAWLRFTYAVTFSQSGLPSGTDWSVTLANQSSHSVDNITFTGIPNGTYNYSVTPVSGFNATPIDGMITVNGFNVPQAVTFTSPTQPGQSSSSSSTFLGLPSTEGYALLAVIVVAAAVAGLLLLRARKPKVPPESGDGELPASVTGGEPYEEGPPAPEDSGDADPQGQYETG